MVSICSFFLLCYKNSSHQRKGDRRILVSKGEEEGEEGRVLEVLKRHRNRKGSGGLR